MKHEPLGSATDRRPVGPRRRFGRLITGVAAVVLVALVALNAPNISPWPFAWPGGPRTTDNSPPTLLVSITDLARFEAASGNFEKVLDVKKDVSWLPDVIYSEHLVFICVGSVDVYVDFSRIKKEDIAPSGDRKSVTIKLPTPALEKPNIDHNQSRVVFAGSGLVNKIGDFFKDDPNTAQKLYQLGEQEMIDGARNAGLIDLAQVNTRKMLTQLLTSLGYTTVTLDFVAP